MFKPSLNLALATVFLFSSPYAVALDEDSVEACKEMIKGGLRKLTDDRAERYQGKVRDDASAFCRGGDKAVKYRGTPWVDWSNYYATGDAGSKNEDGYQALTSFGEKHLEANGRGVDGALLDLEYQRIELIKFNLFDNYTFQTYVQGKDDRPGPVIEVWDEMRLPPDHPSYAAVGGDASWQGRSGSSERSSANVASWAVDKA